jgi:hypothetical protein
MRAVWALVEIAIGTTRGLPALQELQVGRAEKEGEMRTSPLKDPHVWGAVIASKFARELMLPHGNYWEPQIARTLTKCVIEGRKTRDEIEGLMALQLGIARYRRSK